MDHVLFIVEQKHNFIAIYLKKDEPEMSSVCVCSVLCSVNALLVVVIEFKITCLCISINFCLLKHFCCILKLKCLFE